jgi:hypothetical protein
MDCYGQFANGNETGRRIKYEAYSAKKLFVDRHEQWTNK